MLGLLATAVPHETALKWGALAFGSVIGWNAYFINRYRKDVLIGDLAAVIGAVGGSAILALFPAQSLTFAFYGFGLALGFFGYFVVLVLLVILSEDVGLSWILLGKANRPDDKPMLRPAGAPEPPL
jgi:uncharacterized membrane protein YeaQ/YmgE (transglycosylase-associated protein family)